MAQPIAQAVDLMFGALSNGNRILACGNGGSAADCQHFAAELVGRFERERLPLPAMSLVTDSSILTAIGNDMGFDEIFARQIDALGSKGDIAIGISTSGKSPNVLKALKTAKKKKLITVGLTGNDGGKMKPLCDILLVVPSSSTARIQEGSSPSAAARRSASGASPSYM